MTEFSDLSDLPYAFNSNEITKQDTVTNTISGL